MSCTSTSTSNTLTVQQSTVPAEATSGSSTSSVIPAVAAVGAALVILVAIVVVVFLIHRRRDRVTRHATPAPANSTLSGLGGILTAGHGGAMWLPGHELQSMGGGRAKQVGAHVGDDRNEFYAEHEPTLMLHANPMYTRDTPGEPTPILHPNTLYRSDDEEAVAGAGTGARAREGFFPNPLYAGSDAGLRAGPVYQVVMGTSGRGNDA
eukprot:m.92723 g.92723  ORF g.92723 m.92723 type:complete len:208 (-) comp13782_c0_seq1:30-653(-)